VRAVRVSKILNTSDRCTGDLPVINSEGGVLVRGTGALGIILKCLNFAVSRSRVREVEEILEGTGANSVLREMRLGGVPESCVSRYAIKNCPMVWHRSKIVGTGCGATSRGSCIGLVFVWGGGRGQVGWCSWDL